MLGVVRLEGLGDRRPSELSGGQRQRVALARALVNRPAALLLDEPLGALDLKLRREMQFELKRIQQSTGTTFVYVTHDQEEALTMSDRIAVMDGGRVQQLADPKTLYEQPRRRSSPTSSAPRTLSSSASTGATASTRSSSPPRASASSSPADCSVGDSLQVSVRPEKITILAGHGHPADGHTGSHVEGIAVERVYLGSVSQTIVELPGGERVAVHELNDDEVSAVEPGDPVTLKWDPRHSLVVAAALGART